MRPTTLPQAAPDATAVASAGATGDDGGRAYPDRARPLPSVVAAPDDKPEFSRFEALAGSGAATDLMKAPPRPLPGQQLGQSRLRSGDAPEAPGSAEGEAAAGDKTMDVASLPPPRPAAPDGGARSDDAAPAAALPPAEPDPIYAAFSDARYLQAFGMATHAAARGDTAAQVLLGLMYENGYGVPKDRAKAIGWYELAAGARSREGQYMLGLALLAPGPAQNRARAADLFDKAARRGHAEAAYNLGVLYLEGKVRPHDLDKAGALFAEAADAGNADGQYALAVMFDSGRGRPQNDGFASFWFGRAARNGHVDAQVEYAIRLYNGKGLDPDPREAAIWFRKAAEAGNPVAMVRLARLYAAGRGLPADASEATRWTLAAHARGLDDEWLTKFLSEQAPDVIDKGVAEGSAWWWGD